MQCEEWQKIKFVTKACLKAVICTSDESKKRRFEVAATTSRLLTSPDQFRFNIDKLGGIYACRALQGHSVDYV